MSFIMNLRTLPCILLLAAILHGTTAHAADKVYEKPSAFLTRAFGSIPKTRALSLTSAQQKQLASILGHRYHRRLAGHDALALDIDQRRRRSQVDGEIVRKQAVDPIEDHGEP